MRYRLIYGDTETYARNDLVETSGHITGHQSVLLRLPQTGAVLLAIDAVMMERLFTPERKAWPQDENEQQLRASTQKLIQIAAWENAKLVVFGHDGMQWRSLKMAPDFYDWKTIAANLRIETLKHERKIGRGRTIISDHHYCGPLHSVESTSLFALVM